MEDSAFGVRILRDAARIGCVAIGMKVKRYFDEIPAEMCEEAERIGLPLLEIPFYYPFSDFARIVFSELKDRQLDEQQRLLSCVQSISDLYFQDKGVQEMLQRLSGMLHCPVMLTDYNLGMLLSVEEDRVCQPITLDSADPLPAEAGCAQYLNLYADNQLRRFCVVALPRHMGYLCIPAENELTMFQTSLAEHAVKLLGLSLATDRHAYGNRGQYDFLFEYLLSATEQAEGTAAEICHTYGIDATAKRVCICIQRASSVQSQRHQRELIEHLSARLPQNGKLFSHQAFLTVFLFFSPKIPEVDAVAQANEAAERLIGTIEPYGYGVLFIGVGRCYEGTATLRSSFQEALRSAYLAQRLQMPYHALCYSHYLGRHLLLAQNEETLRRICRETVAPLLESDRQNHTELMRTLHSLFACRLNVSAAAKQLFLHRNTLLGRLERIRELVGFDLQDWEQLYSLYLGMCAAEQLSEA